MFIKRVFVASSGVVFTASYVLSESIPEVSLRKDFLISE